MSALELRGRLVLDDAVVAGRLTIEDDTIAAVDIDDDAPGAGSDLPYLAPGFVDVHVHGWGGFDAMGDGAALDGMARALLRRGVTSFLPTGVTSPLPVLHAWAESTRTWLRQPPADGAQPLGVRLVTTSDLRLAIGGLGQATMMPNGGGGVSPDGIVALSFNALGGGGSLSVLYGSEAIPLRSTAFLYYSRVSRASNDPFPLDNIMLVYGVPTPAAAVPSAGVERYGGPSATDAVEIDFATGRVTGQLQTEGGVIDVVDASLLPDRTGFAGRVRGGGGQIDAAIEARFTGVGAREIMYRWIHPLGSGKPAGVGALLRR